MTEERPVQKKVNLPVEEFYSKAKEIIDGANRRGIHLRMLGSVAVYHQLRESERERDLFLNLGRIEQGVNPFTDLDLIAYKKEYGKVVDYIEKDLGFLPEQSINVVFGLERNIFHSPDKKYDVDIFYSCLNFSHRICWGDSNSAGKLPDNDYSIKLDDIIAEKLQIHDINKKDLIDLALMFMMASRKRLNLDYSLLLERTADDWGYWYDSKENLAKVSSLTNILLSSGRISRDEEAMINSEIAKLTKKLDESDKTLRWKRRSKRGTSLRWYNEIEEVER
ncbi:MAG: hypothetical protein QXW80_05850 [Candidatus Micrarchaeia archaeon]